MTNSSVIHNGNASSGGGVQIAPMGGGAAKVSFDRVTIAADRVGMAALSSGQVVDVQLMDSKVTNNTNIGIVTTGVAVVRIGRCAVTNNQAPSSVGTLYSYLDNQISGNNPDVTPTTVTYK